MISGSWDGALRWALSSAGSLLVPLPLPLLLFSLPLSLSNKLIKSLGEKKRNRGRGGLDLSRVTQVINGGVVYGFEQRQKFDLKFTLSITTLYYLPLVSSCLCISLFCLVCSNFTIRQWMSNLLKFYVFMHFDTVILLLKNSGVPG